MKAGFERVGRTVTVEAAQRMCFDKVRYDSRNAARDRSAHLARKYPGSQRQRPYRCTLCGDFHLTTQIPAGLKGRNGKPRSDAGLGKKRA